MRRVQRQSDLTKDVVATSNNARQRYYTITWHIKQTETAVTEQGQSYVRQNGGVFYDLLPDGASLDPNSVMVVNEQGEIHKSAFKVEQFPYYNEMDRVLLKVTITEPGDWYELYYDTIHPYESIRDYGNLVYNPVAYETGNDDIKFGVENSDPDKPIAGTSTDYSADTTEYMTDEHASMVTNLPSDAQGEKFIYAEREYDLAAITASSTGLSKRVRTVTTPSYTFEGMTPINADYSYRLRFQNSYMNPATDVVFFDNLEIYDEDPSDPYVHDWQGTLKAIDVGDLNNKDVPFTVWVSTQVVAFDAQSSLSELGYVQIEDYSEAGLAAWQSEHGKIRSVAVDCSQYEDGSGYVLEPGGSLTIYLYMTAPSAPDTAPETGYPSTFNNMSVRSRIINETNPEDEPVTIKVADYTAVRLFVTGDVDLLKVSPEDEAIYNISFRLQGTSDYGTSVDRIESSSRNGYVSFQNLEKGHYLLYEYETTPDWLRVKTQFDVIVDAFGRVWISDTPFDTEEDGSVKWYEVEEEAGVFRACPGLNGEPCPDTYNFTDGRYTVVNEPRVHTDLLFMKSRKGQESVFVEGAVFELRGVSDYGNEITITGTSNRLGIVNIRNVEIGTYTLTEIVAPEGYILDKTVYRVVVTGTNNTDVTAKIYRPVVDETGAPVLDENGEQTYELMGVDGYPTIPNTPEFWDVNLRKVDATNPSLWLQGAVLRLSGDLLKDYAVETGKTDENGDPVIQGAKQDEQGNYYIETVSDENGRISFQHLKAGTYILTETQAPTNVDGSGHTGTGGTLNYLPDSREYVLTLKEDGSFTVDGLELNEHNEYIVKNERSRDGEIIIYKKWVDDGNDANRPDPVVEMTTDPESMVIHGITVTKLWVNDIAAMRPENLTVQLYGQPTGEAGESTGPVLIASTDPADTEHYRPSTGATGGWTMTGTTWTYTFDVTVDGTAAYSVCEIEVPEGYVSSAYGFDNRTPVQSGKATITNTFTAPTVEFPFTGASETYVVPVSGYYKLEAWGAMGGEGWMDQRVLNGTKQYPFSYANYAEQQDNLVPMLGGRGGYSSSVVYLEAGQEITVAVGGAGRTYIYDLLAVQKGIPGDHSYLYDNVTQEHLMSNVARGTELPLGGFNGGKSKSTDDQEGFTAYGGGGGATSFVLGGQVGTGELKNYASQKENVLLVAGGGGGSRHYNHYGWIYVYWGCGGYGGGEEAGPTYFTGSIRYGSVVVSGVSNSSVGELQHSQVNSDGSVANQSTYAAYTPRLNVGSFGEGAVCAGGGYQGGASSDGSQGGTGGTGFVNTGYEGYISGSNLAGNLDFLAPDGSSETGHYGNGYGRITMVDVNGNPIFSNTPGTTPGAGGTDPGTEPGTEPGTGGDDSGSVTPPPSTEYSTLDGEFVEREDGSFEFVPYGEWEHLDGDTWRFVFHVFNDEAIYMVKELIESISDYGYTCDQDLFELDGSKDKSVTFTNRKQNLYGDLTISKTVNGVENSTQTFSFTLTLADHTGTEIIDGLVFVDGVTTFTLAHGQTRTIHNLPDGTVCTVTETANENFTVSYSPGQTVTIVGGQEQPVAVNVTNELIPPPPPQDVALEKIVNGAVSPADQEIEYPFYVELSGLQKTFEYRVLNADGTERMRFTSRDDGTASFLLKLKAGEKVVFKDLPVGAHYRFVESAGDWVASFLVTDASGNGSIIQTGGENGNPNLDLSTAEETVEAGEDVTVSYTNQLTGSQKLRVEKKVVKLVDNSDNDGFEITVHFYKLPVGHVIQSTIGRWVADEMGEVYKTFTLRDGQAVDFSNIPIGAEYTVSEAKNKYQASYVITVPEGQNGIFVRESDANEGANTVLDTQTEFVDRGEDATVTITNTQVLESVEVTKTVTGNLGDRTKQFRFTFTAPAMAGKEVSFKLNGVEETRTLDSDGSLSFLLRHDETAEVGGLPVGTSYTVTEENEKYVASYQVDNGRITRGVSYSGAVPVGGQTVRLINDLEIPVPTGIDLQLWAPLALFGVSLAGLILMAKKKLFSPEVGRRGG